MESLKPPSMQALERLQVADRLINTTYSLVQEPKLFISVVENMFEAMDLSVMALICLDGNEPFQMVKARDFESRLEVLRDVLSGKYHISSEVSSFMLDLKKILESHRMSSVEFTRNQTFVISNDDYDLTTLTIDIVKKLYHEAKNHVDMILRPVIKGTIDDSAWTKTNPVML